MMTGQQRPPERPDKDAGSDDADSRTPMQPFQDLARGLVNVPRDDVKREEHRFAVENTARERKPDRV